MSDRRNEFRRPARLARQMAIIVALAALAGPYLGAQSNVIEQTANGTANWESKFDINKLPAGKYNIYVQGKDNAGNVAIGGPFNVYIDPKSDLPIARVLNPLPGQRVGSDLTIVGTCVDDDGVAKVEVAIDGGPWVEAKGTDLWMLTVNTKEVPDGRRTIAVRGTDINGLVGPVAKVAFDLDHYKPVVTISSPASGALVNGQVKLAGRVSDANGIRDLDFSTNSGTTWTKVELKRAKDPTTVTFSLVVDSKKLKDGPEILVFRSHDGVGSLSLTNHLLMVANAKPVIAVARPLPAKAVHGTVMVAGSVKDVVGIKRLAWDAGVLGKGEIPLRKGDPFFEKNFDSRALKGDRFVVTLTAEDFAGNISTLVIDRKLDRQADKPVAKILFPAAGGTLKAGDHVYGSALDEDGVQSVRWSIDGAAPQEAPADGSFVFALPDLASGKHSLSVVAKDRYGVLGDPATLAFVFDRGPGLVSFDSIAPASGKAGQGGRAFSQGAVVTVDGGEVLVGKATTPNPATKAIWKIGDGPERKLDLAKGAGPNDWTWRIPVDGSFPYGFAPISLEFADAFGNSWGGKGLLYVTNYADPREDTGFAFDESRAAAGAVILAKDDPFVGVFWRDAVASVRLDPPTPLLTASFDGQDVTIAAAGEGKTAPEKVIVTTKKGHEFSAGPWVFVTDTTAPSVTIDSPVQGFASKDAVQVRGRVADTGKRSTLTWRILPSGQPSGLTTDAQGGFSFWIDPKNLGAEVAAIEVDAVDEAGNIGRAFLALTPDVEAPKVEFVAPAPGAELSGSQSVVARLSDLSGIAKVEYAADGQSFAPVEAPGNWIVALVDFGAAAKPTWRVTDKAGNVTLASPDFKLAPAVATPSGDSLAIAPGDGEGKVELVGTAGARKVSASVPALADQSLLDSNSRFGSRLLLSGAVALKGTASTGGGAPIKAVSLSLDKGGTWIPLVAIKDQKGAAASVPLNLSIDSAKQLAAGPGRLLFKIEDFGGTAAFAAVDIFVDNAAPTLAIAGPLSAGTPISGPVPLVVQVSDTAGIASLAWSTGQGQTKDFGATGLGGTYAILLDPAAVPKGAPLSGSIVARDVAGNSATLPVKVVYDATAAAPKVSIEFGADAKFLAEGERISARANGPDGAVALSLSLDGTALAASDGGAIDIAVPALAPGKHQLLASATDVAGRKTELRKDFIALGRSPVLSDLAVGDAKSKTPFLPGVLVAIGPQGILSGNALVPNGLVSLECTVNGKAVPASIGKAATPGAAIPFTIPLAGLPYGKVMATLTAKDSAGLATTRDFVFVSILPAKSGVDDEDALRFADSRIVAGEGGTTVFLAPEGVLAGRFKGRSIASVALSPATPLLDASYDGSIVTITPKDRGSTAPTKVLVTTIDGDVFEWGPAVFSVDDGGLSLSLDAPTDLSWPRAKLRIAGSAKDEKEEIASVEYSIGGGDWKALPKSVTAQASARQGGQAAAQASAPPPLPSDPGPNAAASRARISAAKAAADAVAKAAADALAAAAAEVAKLVAADPHTWNFDSTIDLTDADGTLELAVRAKDKLGRVVASQRVFTKDTEAPIFTQILPAPDEAVNGLTTFVGEVSDGGRVVAVDFLPAPGKDLEAVDGLLGFGGSLDLVNLPSPLADGAGFRATDAAGNVAILQPKLTIDVQADKPVVQIGAPAENEVIRQDFAVAGVTFDDDGVKSISYSVDGGEWKDMPLEGMGFSLPIALADTTDNGHSIEIKATDIYGVVGDTVKRSWRISKEEPFAVMSQPPADRVVSGFVEVSGQATDANGVKSVSLSFDNGTGWVSPTISGGEPGKPMEWKYRLDTRTLSDGAHAVLLRPVDGYDTQGLAAALVTVDNTPPVALLDEPLDGETATGSLAVSGRISDNTGLASARLEIAPIGAASPAIVKVDLDTSRVQSKSIDISSLSPGQYVVRLIATDRAGNQSVASRNFEAIGATDREWVEILFPEPGATAAGPLTVSGTVHANSGAASVDLLADGTKIGEGKPGPRGEFVVTLKDGLAADGAHELSAVANLEGGRSIASSAQRLDWRTLGPWLTIDSVQPESFLPYRPFLRGHAGMRVVAPDGTDKKAVADFQKNAANRKVILVEISLDGGRSWDKASGAESWSYRIETQNYPEGPFYVIARATFGDGSVVSVPVRFDLDKTPPALAVLSPPESSRQNQVIDVFGTASDADGIESVKVLLRKGDKSNYELPSFVQGLYLDAHTLGATYWEIGAGLTFFGDNVKLQALYGMAPEKQPDGSVTSFGGSVFGAKLIANLFYFPLASLLGPDWDWLSFSVGLGTDFSYFTIVNGDPNMGLMLSSVFGQVEFPKVTLNSLAAFKKYSVYYEQQIWVLSSVVQGGFIFKPSFGVRLGIF